MLPPGPVLLRSVLVLEEDEAERLRRENTALRNRVAELELLATAARSIPAFIIHLGVDLHILWVNRVLPCLQVRDVIGRPVWDFTTPCERTKIADAIERARASGATVQYYTNGPGPEDGRAEYDSYVSPFGDGEIVLVTFDITEHRRHVEALRTSEEKLRVALAATRVGLWSWDLQNNEVLWDEGMRALTGCDEPVAIDRYVEQLVHPDDREKVLRSSRITFETGTYQQVHHRIVRPDGDIRWVWPTGRMVVDASGRVVRIVGGLVDVTEQRRVEEQLRKAQRMDAVGRLTAGIAHNFNNMLTAILPSLELLRQTTPVADHELLDDAMHAGTRAAEMVAQLMTFSGQRRIRSPSAIDPKRLVGRALHICRHTFDRHIVLASEIPDELPGLVGDEGALEQVLVNLLLNARDSVRESGRAAPRITVCIGVADATVASHPEACDDTPYVRIRVEDDGAGVSPEVRARLFEPFFTTKAVDAGTGLGLATSYAIVREHGGFIEYEPREPNGAAFNVFLPVQQGNAPVLNPTQRQFAAATRSGKVLLVDDELAVRRVVARLLKSLGYEAVTVGDGPTAVAMLESHADFDVVLLDRSMPGAPGDHFIDAIRRAAPQVKLLFFTGQAVDDAARRRVDGLIGKPVTALDLERALRHALADDAVSRSPPT